MIGTGKNLRPWILVSIGILFNALSALITHYFIGLNDQQLELISQQSVQLQTRIDSQWRLKTETERQQEFLVLLLNQISSQDSSNSKDINSSLSYIRARINRSLEQMELSQAKLEPESNIDYATIDQSSQVIKNKIIQSINNTYLEKLELESRQQPIRKQNSLLMTIAIFLQISGLILVLARDFK